MATVKTSAEMIEPYKGKIYDPCCGSGCMFVQSLKFIDSHNGNKKDDVQGNTNVAGNRTSGAISEYQDKAGYCKSATLDEIKANDFVLTPGRYVGAADIEDDGIGFEVKMKQLSQTLYQQMDEAIRKNLEVLGYDE